MESKGAGLLGREPCCHALLVEAAGGEFGD
jgi:hypothetical protein